MNSNDIKLIKISVRNYRNCRRTKFSPNVGISALIGINGSGKTTILNAIALLKRIFNRRTYYIPQLPTSSEQAYLKATFKKSNQHIQYRAKVALSTNERNVDEILTVSDEWNFDDFLPEKLGWIILPISIFEHKFSHAILNEHHYEFERQYYYQGLHRSTSKQIPKLSSNSWTKLRELMSKALDLVRQINYYSASQFTNPLRAPSSFELEEGRPRQRDTIESTHISFLHDLYRAYKRNDPNYKQFLSIVSRETLGLVEEIKFKTYKFPTNQYEVKAGGKLVKKDSNREIIIPFFSIGDLRLSPNQLSEGTLKTIALLFYLVTDESKLLLVEEPEVCVHHGLLTSIIELMNSISSEKQVIFSTHSDFVLDRLEPSDVFFVQYSADNGIETTNLPKSLSKESKAALKAYLANTGSLGEYIRTGGENV